MTIARFAACGFLTAVLAAAQSLDYDVYKSKVEPIFLKKRPGHARCVACHEANNTAFRLQPLERGVTNWTEEQSRKNFEAIQKVVTPGNPATSKLLIHPLATEGGGDIFHSGGQQFLTKDDPDWQTMANWIKQAK